MGNWCMHCPVGQKVEGQGHTVMKTVMGHMAASEVSCGSHVLLLLAWDCTSCDCLGF